MDSKGPYSPPSGGNSLGGEGDCKPPVLTDMEGSKPSPPTPREIPDSVLCTVEDELRRQRRKG